MCEKKVDDRAQHHYCDVCGRARLLVLFSHHVMLHVLASVTNPKFGNNHFHGYIDRQKEKQHPCCWQRHELGLILQTHMTFA